jgi:type IV pilus assembly protein PilW
MSARSQIAGVDKQRGFTLVELMIAVVLALFLMGGLLTLVGAMKRTTGLENSLDQLHDSQRMAMTIMTDVIQQAGYFPITSLTVGTATVASQLPVIGTTWVAGQSVSGTASGTTAAPVDSISVRYLTAGGDGVLNCAGATSGTAVTWINTFQIDGNGNLQCQLTTITAGVASAPVTYNIVSGLNNLGVNVGGVKYMRILYGVQSNTVSGFTSVDTYMTADQVTANTLWSNVISVQMILYFSNPLTGQPGQTATSLQTIRTSRVIDLMNKAGVT